MAVAEVSTQQLALASAERALHKARVAAPFTASVAERLVQTGETVAPGTPLYLLVQTDGAEVSARIDPQDADSLRRAREPRFVHPDGGAVALQLLRVAATPSSPARTVEVRLSGAQTLVPGSDGRLVWTDPRLHVPASLLVRRNGALGVFTVQAKKAHFVALPHSQEGRAAPVRLPPDTLLVTDGHQSLRDGVVVPDSALSR
jgi:multidrug efflux pump subunit AcrA (membrane-fusion protein)